MKNCRSSTYCNQSKPTATTASLQTNFPGGSFANSIVTKSVEESQHTQAMNAAYRYILGDQWGLKHETI